MKAIATTLIASFALLAGCAPATISAPQKVPSERATVMAKHVAKAETLAPTAEPVAAAPEQSDARAVGDYVTFGFSGSYRKKPLRLTQRVVAKAEGKLTVDYSFVEGKTTETLRVTTREADGAFLRAEQVAADGSVEPLDQQAFESKLASTVAVADENEALVDETALTVKVGAVELPVTKSTFSVRIGAKKATLETISGRSFPWGDVGGKITTSDGKVFFHAELLDMGGAQSRTASLD